MVGGRDGGHLGDGRGRTRPWRRHLVLFLLLRCDLGKLRSGRGDKLGLGVGYRRGEALVETEVGVGELEYSHDTGTKGCCNCISCWYVVAFGWYTGTPDLSAAGRLYGIMPEKA